MARHRRALKGLSVLSGLKDHLPMFFFRATPYPIACNLQTDWATLFTARAASKVRVFALLSAILQHCRSQQHLFPDVQNMLDTVRVRGSYLRAPVKARRFIKPWKVGHVAQRV